MALVRLLGLMIVLAFFGAAVVEALLGHWIAVLVWAVLFWMVGEGWRVVTARVSTRRALEHVAAGDVMQPFAGAVNSDENLAAVMWKHRKLPETAVLSVFDEQDRFAGLLPLALVDHMLQGKWPTTRVAGIMLPASLFPPLESHTALPALLAKFAQVMQAVSGILPSDLEQIDPLAVASVPVIDGGIVRGVICWRQVEEYEDAAAKAGIAEAATLLSLTAPRQPRLIWRRLVRLGAVLAIGVLLLSTIVRQGVAPAVSVASAVPEVPVGSTAGAQAWGTPSPTPGAAITFGELTPADGAILGRGVANIKIVITSPTKVQNVTMTLNGDPLEVALAPSSVAVGGNAGNGGNDGNSGNSNINHVTASAQGQAYLLGPYTIHVAVQAEGGLINAKDWNFQVLSSAPTMGPIR